MNNLASKLKQAGVTDVYFCAGSRNRPILPLLEGLNLHYDFDERSASFKALGRSKISNSPVVICTTSGSAVLECIPALAEAYYTNTKLILISADRTPDHIGTGFAQTIDQTSPTSAFCRDQHSIDLDQDIDLTDTKFPLQLNVYTEKSLNCTREHLFEASAKTVVLFTGGAKDVEGQRIYNQIKDNTLHFVESNSEIKTSNSAFEIHSDMGLSKVISNCEIEQIVRVGRSPISKCWRNINDNLYPSLDIFHLDPDQLKRLPFGSRINIEDILSLNSASAKHSSAHSDKLSDLIDKFPSSEMAIMHKLGQIISQDDHIFLGNSLTVRTWKLTSRRTTKIHTNRGTNGIDGLVSTAIGIAQSIEETVYCIIGDLSFFYDYSGLAFSIPDNLKIVVINNGGGRIFETISPSFTEVVCDHKVEISELVSGMNISAKKIVGSEIKLSDLSSSQLVEIVPDNKETKSFLSEWRELHE